MAISKKEPKVNLLEVLKGVVEAKDMDDSVVLNALKEALVTAARKYQHIEKKIDVDFDMETNEVHVYLRVAVVDIYHEETKIEKDTCTPVFTAALFTLAETWKQPKCPLTDEWIKKMW